MNWKALVFILVLLGVVGLTSGKKNVMSLERHDTMKIVSRLADDLDTEAVVEEEDEYGPTKVSLP